MSDAPLPHESDAMGIWIVRGGYGLWVVRAMNAKEACDTAFSGPRPEDDTTAEEYGVARAEMEAFPVSVDGERQIIDHYFG